MPLTARGHRSPGDGNATCGNLLPGTHVDVGVVPEKLVSDVLDLLAGVRDVCVGLPVTLRGVGVAGRWCGVGHSGGRHHTHRLPCQEEVVEIVRQKTHATSPYATCHSPPPRLQ